MALRVKVDRQGRLVIPLHERERLGIAEGGTLELSATPEGVLLERHRPADVRIAVDGLPVIAIEELEPVSNQESVDAIHRERERS
jgi:AbrB family looped-hinge helix DNA binding protein